MRIASVSDLHVEHAANREVLIRMAGIMEQKSPDLILVAGDVSHLDTHIALTIRSFKLVAEHVAYLPGNHDLWTVPWREGTDTWRRHDRDLAQLVESEGGHYLPARSWVKDGVAVVGTCGWYDHGFLQPAFRDQVTPEMLEEKRLGGAQWTDRRFVEFLDGEGEPMSDGAVTKRMLVRFESQLAEAEANPEVRHVVAATHHLAFPEAVHRTGQLPWEFFNAFMGSPRFGEAIRRYSKVRAAVYGHTHVPGDRRLGDLRLVGTPLGNPREWSAGPGSGSDRIAWIDLPS